jgi:DNA-binding NtrC family response regulator
MVASLLLVGLDARHVAGIEAEVGAVPGAAEAMVSLSRRAWDVVLVGGASDVSPESVVTALARRYPSTPVIFVGDAAPGGLRDSAWEVVAPGYAPAITDAVRRALEVARLRRDVARMRDEHEDRPRRAEVARAFEQGSIHDMERLMIMERLARMNQNRTHSAASLDISVRTLRNKLREYREQGQAPNAPAASVLPGEAR